MKNNNKMIASTLAAHSSVLAWRIPGTGEPGGLPSLGSQSRTPLKRLSSSSSIFLFYVLFHYRFLSIVPCSCSCSCSYSCSSPGFSVHRISQARILEQVAISFTIGFSQPRDRTHVSCVAGRFFTDETPEQPM